MTEYELHLEKLVQDFVETFPQKSKPDRPQGMTQQEYAIFV